MKGVIVQCLEELVCRKFGSDKWREALARSGLSERARFVAVQDVEDATVLKVVGSVCEVLGISLPQAADAFGEYWVNVFAPSIYGAYYRQAKSAREFLLNMDRIHAETTRSLANARPPRFGYAWKDDRTLVMTYKSHRNLIDFLVGLARGVGTYYEEALRVTKVSDTKVQIEFVG
jgi:hypothetical protein